MLPTALLLLSHTLTFPLGTLEIPDRCGAPESIDMNMTDGFIAVVECPTEKLKILLYGEVYFSEACKGLPPGPKGKSGAPALISLKTGGTLPVCVSRSRDSTTKRMIEETWVDLGSGFLSAEIRSPRHLALLAEIASSFRRRQK